MRAMWSGNQKEGNLKWMNLLENLFVVILVFYPLRHIGYGIDFRDTGYNYANFQYMGTEHMDPMWLFSTYLANVTGNLLMKLPKADTMIGMNLYTGLFVSVLALAGYFFCTRKIKMPKVLVFLGEMMAISLCWCPTAVLYNYLTYLLFLGSFLLLYCGLLMETESTMDAGYSMEVRYYVLQKHYKKQRWMLAGAGALLGMNVLVRFSNLPEAAMIVAVWAYNVILWLEERKRSAQGGTFARLGKRENSDRTGTEEYSARAGRKGAADRTGMDGASSRSGEGFWHRLMRHTLWCLLGYAAALAVLLGYIHLRFGIGEYIAGIVRLFAMTENAADYKASSMLMGLVEDYRENLYWAARIGVIIAGGVVLFFVTDKLTGMLRRVEKALGQKNSESKQKANGAEKTEKQSADIDKRNVLVRLVHIVMKMLHIGVRIAWLAVSAAMLVWLYDRGVASMLFYSYDPIRRPCILFLMLTMLIGVIRIFHKDSPKEEKLLSGMLILVILLTSIGSNNRTFPSWNNLFVAAPYTLWESWRFVWGGKKLHFHRSSIFSCGKEVSSNESTSVSGRGFCSVGKGILFPVRTILLAFLGMCMFQAAGFGVVFVFAESTGVQNATAYVENNKVLKNIKMPADRAQWLTELSACVEVYGLQGEEVILYGEIPGLSYYLQMPSAFNPWSDLRSYSLETMENDMAQLEKDMAERGEAKPVILLENTYALYVERETGELTVQEDVNEKLNSIENDGKWKLIMDFMKKYGYQQILRNEKFALYQ